MPRIATITRQGQLTIPKSLRDSFGITGARKVRIRKQGNTMVIEPKDDFWTLPSSLRSPVALTDAELASAKKTFVKKWPRQL